jgi:hypothetical protein
MQKDLKSVAVKLLKEKLGNIALAANGAEYRGFESGQGVRFST